MYDWEQRNGDAGEEYYGRKKTHCPMAVSPFFYVWTGRGALWGFGGLVALGSLLHLLFVGGGTSGSVIYAFLRCFLGLLTY